MLEFRILGPLEVLEGGTQVRLGGAKQRALLALLLIHRREAVSTDLLVDQLWGARPPATAAKSVQVYVSQLRKLLGRDLLVTRGGGYALEADSHAVDADRFAGLAEEGRRALESGEAERAAELLREALGLWRGPPLADFAYDDFARPAIDSLEEARLAALEDRIDADLALGRHAALISELRELAREHPLRDRLQRQLMLALYRSGRQAEALEHYRWLRQTLIDEAGLEPSPASQELERAILSQDPGLDAPRQPSFAERLVPAAPGGRGALLIATGGLLLLALAVTVAILSLGGDEAGVEVRPNSVAVIDLDSNEVVADIPVGVRPGDISVGERAVWVANLDDASVSEIDPETMGVLGTRSPGTSVDALAAGEDGVWVTDVQRSILTRLDPTFQEPVATLRIGNQPTFARVLAPVATGVGAVWVGSGAAKVIKVSPEDNRTVARVDVGNEPAAIAVDESEVWVADDADNTVTRIDARSAAVTGTIPVGQGPSAIAAGADEVWVANTQEGTVTRLDQRSGAATDTIDVGGRPTGVAVGAGGVWVADSLEGRVLRIDPATGDVSATVETGQSPQALAVVDGRVWVSAQAESAPPEVSSAEGEDVLRVLASEDPGGVHPTFAFGSQLSYATCGLLENYPDQPAPAGEELVPEVADGPPSVSADGRTYTYTIRPGYRFSPPSNGPVTAAAFERAIERALGPELATGILPEVVGAKAFAAGHSEHLAGVDAIGDQLRIELVRPAPDLRARLAVPTFCAVPPDTPITPEGHAVIPSAGPYYVASYAPDQSIVLRRNPNYDGSRPAEIATIQYEIGVPPARAIEMVEAGAADYYSGELPVPTQDRLAERYGPHSEAAQAGAQQYFVVPELSVFSLVFNPRQPPFDDVRLRRAVNFAIDRPALARSAPVQTGRPTDQYIPPGVPGFRDEAFYPLGGPDVARARELAPDINGHVVLYTCSGPSCARSGQVVRQNLAAIGLDVEVRQFSFGALFGRIADPNEPYGLAFYGWFGDYADPFNFTNAFLLAGPSPPPLDDPALERQMSAAAKLSGEARSRAYAAVERSLARAAPAAPFANGTGIHFFSPRIGCQIQQPIYGIDLGRLCLRD